MRVVVTTLLLSLAATSGFGQDDTRATQLTKWMEEFKTYQKWDKTWRNRFQRGVFMRVVPRKHKPQPPPWLEQDCQNLVTVESNSLLTEACLLLAEWHEDVATAQIKKEEAAQRQQKEKVEKTKFWEHVHLDGLWPMTQTGAKVFGVIGTHATFPIGGRLQLYAAPGAMLVNLPDGVSGRKWVPAYDWGFSVRLSDFKFPSSQRIASVHFNLAKVWVIGGPQVTGMEGSIDLAGLSLTFKGK
jgi:hypothetical protein